VSSVIELGCDSSEAVEVGVVVALGEVLDGVVPEDFGVLAVSGIFGGVAGVAGTGGTAGLAAAVGVGVVLGVIGILGAVGDAGVVGMGVGARATVTTA
jgi:hypothetical protein